MRALSPQEQRLGHELLEQPRALDYRFNHAADCHLRRVLFHSLAGYRQDYLRLFFPNGPSPDHSQPWSLRDAQGAEEGAEYTPSAKGTACGHIFKNGESTYHCRTCAADETCVLCARCFDSSDHEGHTVLISVSPGNSGCCDCGDHEAWRRDVQCSIHTADAELDLHGSKLHGNDKQKAPAGSQLPPDLVESIRMTISRCADYLCDVFSCSPEQLRLPKSQVSILQDERASRLSPVYGEESLEPNPEFALVLWNDEKHTIDDVENQVARACGRTKSFGMEKATEVNDIGRSIVLYSRDLEELLRMAEVIEQLKLTVTIRSARDTFREQMCATIVDWISDISGCVVGSEPYILRNTVCEELLRPWRAGSLASNRDVGQDGIDDHEVEDNERLRRRYRSFMQPLRTTGNVFRADVETEDPAEDDDEDNEDDDDDEEYDIMDMEDEMVLDVDELRDADDLLGTAAADMDMDIMDEGDDVIDEATIAGYPPPPPPLPPTGALRRRQPMVSTPQESEDGEADQTRPNIDEPYGLVPRTPRVKAGRKLRPSKHWLEKPEGFRSSRPGEPCEDLWQRVRLDFLILYDLRLWKTLRIHLRHLYITTVVTIPRFKRLLGLRFAGLYTALAQLYLIADREPDHSIINLSVQMLTTPTITLEVVERGNFLTNLMAILYTFITTRQVGFPEEVNPRATLAFDAGAVTNRRMFHFFLDLRWLFQSELIHHRMRLEPRYLLQFIDLVKLHQGVCPNVRATGEHVEYESDAWISASLIVKEINKLCKQISVAFAPNAKLADGNSNLNRAIRTVGQVVMINAFGYERRRFHAAEVKDDLAWHSVGPFEFEGKQYSVPRHIVQAESMSFHHPLHYLLSWLIENGRGLSRDEMRALLHFSPADLRDPWNANRTAPAPSNLTPDELLSSIFDHPLRVCVWLAQMKAGMWVRNGITLRHQSHTYRGVSHRDVAYQRDIFMVQAGLALCGNDKERPGERFLAQMLDRFQMDNWVKGDFELVRGFEEPQQLDALEDFFHLLVIALSERGNLIPNPGSTEQEQHDKILQHDIAHALCFKPLSFSELSQRVSERVSDSDDFHRVLESMAVFRPPEGLSDTGTFELKQEYVELVDPYYAHYSRNHREEAETIYKKYMARKTGKKPEDIVFEPRLEPIQAGVFAHLSAFTSTALFAQTLGAALYFAIHVKSAAPKLQVTRVETFLHMVLHLVLLAVIEDRSGAEGFTKLASSTTCNFRAKDYINLSTQATVVSLLVAISGMEEYASCHSAIRYILRKMQHRQPEKLSTMIGSLNAILDRADTGSPASISVEDKERKKQEALARQAKIMAQMKQQQNSFLQNQGLTGFDAEFDDLEDDMSMTQEPETIEHRKTWNFPAGTCIYCQEETDDQRLYGTFAFFCESQILRSTPVDDADYIREVVDTPCSLDRTVDELRPFGVAGKNKHGVHKVGADGKPFLVEQQKLSKGFPHQNQGIKGPVATSCGHIMHYSCFETYLTATQRRHHQQIARNHPERIKLKEFICPLCKALGNTFLPIIWKAKECAQEYELHAAKSLDQWLNEVGITYSTDLSVLDGRGAAAVHRQQQVQDVYSNRSFQYVANMFAPSLVQNMNDLSLENGSPSSSHEQRYPLRRGHALSRLFGLTRSTSQGQVFTGSDPIGSPAAEQNRLNDLLSAYRQIEESIKVNQLSEEDSWDKSVNPVLAISRALGLSVSALEISQRGFGSDMHATSLVSDLPEQALTHLRVMSETIESCLAINILKSGSNIVARETVKKRDIITGQLFGTDSQDGMDRLLTHAKPLFEDDVFLFFTDWLSFMAPNVAEASSILQLCFWAEVVKVFYVYEPIIKRQNLAVDVSVSSGNEDFIRAIEAMGLSGGKRSLEDQTSLLPGQAALLRLLAEKYALTFLRKTTMVMHVRYGLEFECPYDVDPAASELRRLTAVLHMPSMDEMCSLFLASSEAGSNFREITGRWIYQAYKYVQHHGEIRLPHPAIFELVGLPKNYDALTEEAIKRRCPQTGKEISDPALCLQCGEIFCSQAFCCTKDRAYGGCYQHMKKHDMKTGVFISIRKCMVLFAHGPGRGCFSHAPYLDRHGETDPTLRKHHQLYLNQKRYDKLLREVWLGHMIPTVISRKLEADINPGGWETL